MKKFRLKKEATPFFKEDLATSIYDYEIWTKNLNVDPKEMRSQGHLFFEWGLPAVIAFKTRHIATMKKYPNTDLGLGL